MAIFEVGNTPWTVLSELIALDRWLIARKWAEPWAAVPDALGTPRVSVIERAVQALRANPALVGLVPEVLEIAPGGDPTEPNGVGDDPSLLRDGAPLQVLISGEDIAPDGWRNFARVEWPGLLAMALGEAPLTVTLPDSVLGVGYRLGRLTVRPSRRTRRVTLAWVGGAPRPILRLTISAAVPGNQVISPVTICWRRAVLEVDLIPEVKQERLLWTHESRLILRVGNETANGVIESSIEHQVQRAIATAFESWGPLLGGVLMSLPFRPVIDGKGLVQLESMGMVELGGMLQENGYPTSQAADPESVASLLVASTVLPANPLRALQLDLADGVRPEMYPARLADHYVRHVRRPELRGTRAAPFAVFDVEPIPSDAGTTGDLGTRGYGHWRPRPADGSIGAEGRHVVPREQYRITFDHFVIPPRGQGLVPNPDVVWTFLWGVHVRHRRLADNEWVTLAAYSHTPVIDQWLVTAGLDAARISWPEVNGELAVTGVLFANTNMVAWFDVGATIREVGPQLGSGTVGSSVAGSAAVLPSRNGTRPPMGYPESELLPEFRCEPVVRAEPLTSLRRATQEWLGIRVAHVHLWRPGPLQHVGPFAALFLELRVGGRAVSMRRLSAEEAGAVRASERALVEGPACDLYLSPELVDPVLPLSVALMGADGNTVKELSVAELPIARDDPSQPLLRWGIHPALGRAPHFMRDAGSVLHVRVDLTDQHYSAADVNATVQLREVDLRLHEIRIEQPTEPFGFNLGTRHFEAMFSSEVGDHVLREVGPVRLGPFTADTSQATPADPVVLPSALLDVLGGGDNVRLPLVAGAVLKVRVDGAVHPPTWPLQELPLGHTVQTRPIPLDEILDPGTPWGPSEPSTMDMFTVSVRTADTRPPAPRFDPIGVLPGQADAAITVPAGATVDFTYACPPWVTAMQLQRRADGADDWSAVSATLVPGAVAQASFTVAGAGVWDYRLGVWFGELGTMSRRVRVTSTA